MTPRLIIGEAFRSLRANRARAVLIGVGLLACMLLPAYLEMVQAQSTISAYREGIATGNGVIVATRQSGDPLDASVCLSMQNEWSVLHSGTVSRRTLVAPTSAPGLSFQLVAYTGDYLEVIDRHYSGSPGGVAIGVAAARDLGLDGGRYVSFPSWGTLEIGAVVDTGERVPEQGRWVFVPDTSTAGATDCWLEAQPGARSAVISDVRARYSAVDDLRVTVLAAEDSQSATANWSERPTRYTWAAAAGVASLLYLLVLLPRRQEVGLRRSLGAARLPLSVQFHVENLCLSVLVVAIASAWLFFVGRLHNVDVAAFWLGAISAVQALCAYLAISLVLTILVVRLDVMQSLKSR